MRSSSVLTAALIAAGCPAPLPSPLPPRPTAEPPAAADRLPMRGWSTRPADADRDEPARPAGHQGQPPGARHRLPRRLRRVGLAQRSGRQGRAPLGRRDHQARREVGAERGPGRGGRGQPAVAPGAPADRAGRPARAVRHGAGRVPPRQGPQDGLGRDRGRAGQLRRGPRRRAAVLDAVLPARRRSGPHAHAGRRHDGLRARATGSSSWPAAPWATSSWRPSTPIWASTSAPPRGSW